MNNFMQKTITKMHKNLNFLCLQEYMGDKKKSRINRIAMH